MNEIWKDIAGYEGYYQVSNMGRVKSLDRLGINGRKLKGKILPQRKRSGYWAVSLRKDGHNTDMSVHRLVAEAFIPNPDNLPQVGHKDEKNLKTSNECNNNVENLEWVTAKENSNTPQRNHRVSESRKGMIFSEEHRRHISEVQKGRKGHPISEENKQKLRMANLGRKASEETKKKLSESHKGHLPANRKRIECDGVLYESQTAFCKMYHMSIDTLSAWLKGKKEMPKEWKDRGLRYFNGGKNELL